MAIETGNEAEPLIGERETAESATVVDGYEVAGGSERLARAVLTGRVRRAIDATSRGKTVLVGDVGAEFVHFGPDFEGVVGRVLGAVTGKIADAIPGEPDTVRIQSRGVPEEGELRAQLEAVVAVADALESV